FNARFNMMPIGTGPFKFVERAFEDYIILERNEKYFGGAPDVEKITFRILPNESIMFLELLQGNIDIMQLKPDQFVKFTDTPEFEKRFVKIKYPEREYTYIGWNLKNRLFADEKVRVAISSAIDKNALIEKTLYNLGQISDGPFYPSSWASNPTIKNIAYDVNAAKKNLEEAGWSDMDADGFLEKKIDVKSFFGYDDTVEIQRFEFGLLINAGNKDRELCAKFIASELKKIGIKVNVDTLEWKDFIKLIDSTSFDAFILTWSLGYDPDISSIWHSSNIPDMKRGKFGLNSISYKNPEVDALLDEARQTIDQNRRIKCYHRIHEIIIKQQPYCFLYIADTLYAVARKIKNAKPSQAGIFYNIEKWKIE
nr:ABC transporter substrate-binding protein [Candidatus Wallbacteria bacterium]